MLWGANVGVTLLFTGRTPLTRSDSTGAVTSWRGAFARLDLRATAPIRRTMSAVLGMDNVLDRRLEQSWPGFTGRRVYGGLSWRAGSDDGVR